jgi:2-polyprenyl-3-methyl-5-hydroxy-6-metoxy-1,4-benzoquinol methylase
MRNFDETKKFFEKTSLYLNNTYGINTRKLIIQKDVIPLINRNLILLDIGCGNGALSEVFIGLVDKITLMDISKPMLKLAEVKFQELNFKNISLINERLEDSNLNEKYDVILAVGVIAHVEDLKEFLLKCRSYLKPQGHLILQFTEETHPIIRFNNFLQKIQKKAMVRSHKQINLKAVLKDQGFNLKKIVKFGFYPKGITIFGDQTVFKIQKSLLKYKMFWFLHDRLMILTIE